MSYEHFNAFQSSFNLGRNRLFDKISSKNLIFTRYDAQKNIPTLIIIDCQKKMVLSNEDGKWIAAFWAKMICHKLFEYMTVKIIPICGNIQNNIFFMENWNWFYCLNDLSYFHTLLACQHAVQNIDRNRSTFLIVFVLPHFSSDMSSKKFSNQFPFSNYTQHNLMNRIWTSNIWRKKCST